MSVSREGEEMIIVSYGGGTNSTAMLVGMKERGITQNAIIFADTGAEKPHTYEHINFMSGGCLDNGFPSITIVRNEKPSRYGSLENMCLTRRCLPSLAYGFKTCSLVYKKEPFDLWINTTPPINH